MFPGQVCFTPSFARWKSPSVYKPLHHHVSAVTVHSAAFSIRTHFSIRTSDGSVHSQKSQNEEQLLDTKVTDLKTESPAASIRSYKCSGSQCRGDDAYEWVNQQLPQQRLPVYPWRWLNSLQSTGFLSTDDINHFTWCSPNSSWLDSCFSTIIQEGKVHQNALKMWN